MRETGLETDVAHMFATDMTGHRLIVRLDQGLHRHLVFESREHSWNNRFELITAPGSLTITGDRGAYTFRRLADMFQFFRSNPDRPHRINIGYWAEKLPDGGRSVKDYSEQVARVWIKEHLDEAIKERDAIQLEFDWEYAEEIDAWRDEVAEVSEGDTGDDAMSLEFYPMPEQDEEWPELVKARELVEQAVELIFDYDSDGMLGYEDGARQLLAKLENIGLVGDTWEWDLSDWDFHFIWCLHAIAWGIQQYDNAVRSGLHKIRTGPMPWDTPLPTTAPTKPERQQLERIDFTVTMAAAPRPAAAKPVSTAAVAGGVL
jgi:hypothetical protein